MNAKTTKYPLVKASEIVPGQQFKKSYQKKFRTLQNSSILGSNPGDKIPAEHQGKILLVTTGCNQWVVYPNSLFQTTTNN